MKDEFKRENIKDFTAWDLNAPILDNHGKRARLAKKFRRKARRNLKNNLKKSLDNLD